jgi:hypothetical protein
MRTFEALSDLPKTDDGPARDVQSAPRDPSGTGGPLPMRRRVGGPYFGGRRFSELIGRKQAAGFPTWPRLASVIWEDG